jgi:hypothetical protein
MSDFRRRQYCANAVFEHFIGSVCALSGIVTPFWGLGAVFITIDWHPTVQTRRLTHDSKLSRTAYMVPDCLPRGWQGPGGVFYGHGALH